MLLMIEKCIRGGICHTIHRYTNANNKYVKHYDKNKESPYLKYWHINNFYGQAMSQKLPVNDVKWVDDISEFNEDFIKSYNGDIDEGYFLEVNVQHLENMHNLHNDLPFLLEKMKSENFEKFVAKLRDKTEYVIT